MNIFIRGDNVQIGWQTEDEERSVKEKLEELASAHDPIFHVWDMGIQIKGKAVSGQDMKYPTLVQVEQADRLQLARWHRFLKSPGWDFTNKPREVFEKALATESQVMQRIMDRFREMGAFNPTISKTIGWGK